MSGSFPYARLPRTQVWKRAVAEVSRHELDPQDEGRFRFDRTTRIASAGSCFARRIANGLRRAGYTYFVTEPGPADAASAWLAKHHYGTYSARYGDVYTTVQLAQLARRAVGTFVPDERPWAAGGRWHDPFRARIEPSGFATIDELEADRARHLAAVRRLLAETEVFVFTLGLTEMWRSRTDGAAFPLCPGAGIGTFDPDRYEFVNLSVDETAAAFEDFLDVALSLNPALQVILTVSPVPLAATMEPRHVVQATTYSKSVLRVAAETLRRRHACVDYFAAYEIATSPFDGIDHYGADRRDVAEPTVERVMRSFFRAFGDAAHEAAAPEAAARENAGALPVVDLFGFDADAVAASVEKDPCDDEYLARFLASR